MLSTLDYQLPQHLKTRRSAERREWVTQTLALAVVAICFVGAGLLVGPISEIRKERQLVIDPASIKGLPPDIALLGKLGTFRALAIDWASIRADRLKEEGKTYEALQLHLTVCRLAPRFPKVWINAAWNMAYNISVMKYTPEARWQWVQNGIKILRDEGITYNPKAVSLYKELAWIYWHKIGDFMDDEHLNYKRALAVEMEHVLGPPPVVLSDQEYFDWFRKIVDAPRDLDAMIRDDPNVARLVSRLHEVRLKPDHVLLGLLASEFRPELRLSNLTRNQPDEEPLTKRRREVLTDPTAAEALERLLAAVRSKELRERHKLDVDWMLELMVEKYGPLDWRNAFSHALYWASIGDRRGRGRAANTKNEQMTNARFIFYALQSLIMRGRMTLWPDFDDPFSSYLELTPDVRYIPYLYRTYMRLGEEHFKDDPRYQQPPGPIYKTGLVSAMQNWIELLYLEGGQENLRQAENYYAWLRENNPHPDGSTQQRYQQSLDQFVVGDILSQLETYKAAGGFIRSLVVRALKHRSLGQTQQALANLKRARQCYDYWMVDTRVDINDRRKMQPFIVILRDVTEAYFKRPEIAPLFKARLWKEMNLKQRQMVYDRLQPYFLRLCDAQVPPWELNKAFAEPTGLEEFRRTDIEYRGAPRREDAEQGEGKRH